MCVQVYTFCDALQTNRAPLYAPGDHPLVIRRQPTLTGREEGERQSGGMIIVHEGRDNALLNPGPSLSQRAPGEHMSEEGCRAENLCVDVGL